MWCVWSSFYLFLIQTATLKVQVIFNVPESTALCIFRSTSVLLPPTSSRILTSSSRVHPRGHSLRRYIASPRSLETVAPVPKEGVRT